jgi:hypothetical protein
MLSELVIWTSGLALATLILDFVLDLVSVGLARDERAIHGNGVSHGDAGIRVTTTWLYVSMDGLCEGEGDSAFRETTHSRSPQATRPAIPASRWSCGRRSATSSTSYL